jgi:hypothetical protein
MKEKSLIERLAAITAKDAPAVAQDDEPPRLKRRDPAISSLRRRE